MSPVASRRSESSLSAARKVNKDKRGSSGVSRIRTKRIYDPAAKGDGFRVLVDRLWPRGITRTRASLDAWEKEIAPSPALREWFDHTPERFAEFRRRYLSELKDHRVELEALKRRSVRHPGTLLYAAKSPDYNHARVLKEAIEAI